MCRPTSKRFLGLLLLPALAWSGGCAAAPTLISENAVSGFAIYRSGQLTGGELQELCEAGVEEMLVLNGGGAQRECVQRETRCANLRIRYDLSQTPELPLSREFLRAFDQWVEAAQRDGRRIAFHCRHGWHRAGRLAAYYRMRFEGMTPDEAIEEMLRMGRLMDRHPYLEPQVRALADWIAGRPCGQEARHCPGWGDGIEQGLDPAGRFAADSCPR